MPTVIQVDFTDVSLEFEPIPAGLYEVSVNSVEVLPSKKTKKPYVKWTFRVEVPEHDGRLLFFNTTLQKQGLFSLAQTLMALGYEVPKDSVELDLDDTIGLRCMARVTQELYQGNMKNKVDGLVAVGGEEEDIVEVGNLGDVFAE